MFQFEVLSGKQAGGLWLARRFPVRLGRSRESDLRVEEPGVYDAHAAFAFDEHRHLQLHVLEPATAAVNDEPTRLRALRNGDVLRFGSVTLRLWLAPVRQRGLRLGEALLWLLWFGVAIAQLALLRWLWN